MMSLRSLFDQYYLIKRDDASCHNMFAIISVKKCIELDLAFAESGLEDDDELSGE